MLHATANDTADCTDTENGCESEPCLHGGLCEDTLDGYVCHCDDVFFSGPKWVLKFF